MRTATGIVMDTVSPVPGRHEALTAELMKAEEPYLEGRWAEAETAYRQYLDANPRTPSPGTGSARARSSRKICRCREESRARHRNRRRHARRFLQPRVCHALAGQPDAALDNVERAIGAGFRKRAAYESDPDLASLRELPRFKALMQPLE
jgi:hypothetical protein